jgi:two-component system, NarL family, response regulator NreC
MPKVLIVDDHAFIRRGVQAILKSVPEWEMCGEADNGKDAVRLAGELHPEVIVMDVSMPGLNGIEATRSICRNNPGAKVVLLTLHESDELLRNGFQAGARGYLMKSDAEEELVRALRVVMGSESYISPRFSADTVNGVIGSLAK